MNTRKATTPRSSNPTKPTAAPTAKRRKVIPSVMTPFLADVAQDVTSPTLEVSATPTVPTTSTASAAATPTTAQSIAAGALPVVSTAATDTPPVATSAPPNVVNPPPEEDIPSPPAGFMAPNARDFLGYRPNSREVAAASTAVANLGSADDWVQSGRRLVTLRPKPDRTQLEPIELTT